MYFGCRFLVITIYFMMIIIFSVVVEYADFLNNFFYIYLSDKEIQNVFDYIIVGSGSAGSVVAKRLSADKSKKILVLEAGKYGTDLFNIPSVGLLLQGTNFDWQYETVPQKNACLALNHHVSKWPMGKILGGTSMLNNMLYNRGNKKDFDEWFEYKENYNYYKDVLPYFKKLEEYNSERDISKSYSSIYVSDLIFTSILPSFLLKAAKSLGYPILENNVDCKIGFSKPKANLFKSKRWTSASNLKSSENPNLFIKTNSMVEKVLLKHNFEAYGVKYHYLGKTFIAKAKKGIVLSAGVVGTPKILMLSGIGKKKHLENLKIRTIIDLPVGDNLQDHITTGLDLVLLNQTMNLGIESMLSPFSILEYFKDGTGPWTTTGCEIVAFCYGRNISLTSEERPDLQLMVMPLAIKEDEGVHLRKLIGISDQIWSNYFALSKNPAITILPLLLHPKSRGTIRLRNKDPWSKPLINPRYLTNPEDADVLIRGIEIIKSLLDVEDMKILGAELNSNVFPGCKMFKFDTKDYWKCYIRHLTVTAYHPVGTCKMGDFNNNSSVVDYNFKVKNTNKLFIVDGSLLPSLTSGNINGAILMMAEMGSDVIKMVDYLNMEKCRKIEMLVPKNWC